MFIPHPILHCAYHCDCSFCMTIFVGIDPGRKGAIAIIYLGKNLDVFPMPYTGNVLDLFSVLSIVKPYAENDCIVYIEKVFQPNKLVCDACMIEGALFVSGYMTYRVAPQTWRKAVLKNYRASKQDAIDFCLKNYPDVDLKRTAKAKKYSDGKAEAICIARYGLQKHGVYGDTPK